MKILRRILLAGSFIVLIFAVLSGLARFGWQLGMIPMRLSGLHGPLMVAGFLGTLISLERATALNRVWGYAGPLLSALGTVTLLTGTLAGSPVPLISLFAGAAILVAILTVLFLQQPALHGAVLLLGSILLAAGNGLFVLGRPIPEIVPWWLGFLIVTIAGERLELSRLVRLPSSAQKLFIASLIVLVAGLFIQVRVFGFGMLALGLWMVRHDISWRTVKTPGLTRFIALCLLSANLWLIVSGVLMMSYGIPGAGPVYDAILHSAFLGFVFSMIFGHAPIIFPSVAGVTLPFRSRFYAHWALLHVSVLIRVAIDLASLSQARAWAGMATALALLLFFVNTASAIAFQQIKTVKSRTAKA